MEVRYYLYNNAIVGLEDLVAQRPKIMRETVDMAKDRDRVPELIDKVWKRELAIFWVGNPLLVQFDLHEVRVNLGSECVVQICSKVPAMDIVEMQFVLDARLRKWCTEPENMLIEKIVITGLQFERKANEPDPRGYYHFAFDYETDGVKLGLYGFVRQTGGCYELQVECCAMHLDPQGVLSELSQFCLDVINGVHKPLSDVPDWLKPTTASPVA